MPTTSRPFAPVKPHGELREVLADLFVVTGTFSIGPMSASRNMTVVREGERLVLVNSVRLDDAGLAALDALGTVTDIVKLAGSHGADDPFYKDRYDATVWRTPGMTWFSGLDMDKGEVYFDADKTLGDDGFPLQNASLYVVPTRAPEGFLRLPVHGGTLLVGDALQHWPKPDAYFNLASRIVMRLMGFIGPHRLGIGWLKAHKPDKDHIRSILDLDFDNLIPAHGEPVLGGARDKYIPAVDRYTGANQHG